ncbi:MULTISPECIES: hypothetical protein [unclassified Brevibacterium]|uniref:hypothetical protein n=1 Tax=unclassified Brevibacterium TaxID=2614124 RepID=UPI0008A3966E|nr:MULTISPECIES: hypothetical protein [unclassified Brevibacterium]OFS27339.1 hypothetical protein HMPREF3162_02300 [Brevibacterium sp. HMSC07C04]
MKKLLAAAGIVCIGFASCITTAAPANADSRRWPLCLDDPRLVSISPSPITETQLKQQGAKITVNAKGLPPNTLGLALVIKNKLQTADDLFEPVRDQVDDAGLQEFKAFKAMNISHSDSNEYLFGDIDLADSGVIARRGYVVSDESGTASFTFGGTEEVREESSLTPEQEELAGQLRATSWSSQLPESEADDYTGDYSVLLLIPRNSVHDLYQLAFDENNSLVPVGLEGPTDGPIDDKHKAVVKQREEILRGQGVSEDLTRRYASYMPAVACTGFKVTDTPPETPEPDATPTPEPSPTPSESSTPNETPKPEPSESSTPTPDAEETPTPEPGGNNTPTPAPEPKESTTPAPGDSSPSAMPRTGTHIMGALAAAGTLLALGTAITVLSRRRSQRQ